MDGRKSTVSLRDLAPSYLFQWMLRSIHKQLPVSVEVNEPTLASGARPDPERCLSLQYLHLNVLLVKSQHYLAMVGDLYLHGWKTMT